MKAFLISLNIGKPSEALSYNGKPLLTAMLKQPVTPALWLDTLGFADDDQADTKHHGGPDKAVCVYAEEHYSYWNNQLGFTLPVSAFGENVTSRGIVETEVHIGDVFRLGEALVQVTQPRQPCYKLSARYNLKELPIWMQNTGYTGYYLRVLEAGYVKAGDSYERVQPHDLGLSIQYANEAMHHKLHGEEGLVRLISNEALSQSWRTTFEKRLQGSEESTAERLSGVEPS